MDIYTEYLPYVYLIGWSQHNTWYYGRRTAKKCNPSELWVSYFTSSKEVKKFRRENGEPDIISIRHTFPNNPKKCSRWESAFLRRFDAKNDPRFLNKRNGDEDWDTTGMVAVIDDSGEIRLISNLDEDWISGKLQSPYKGKAPVKDKRGNNLTVDVNDPRYTSGDLVHVATGVKQSPETIEKRVKHVRGVPKSEEHNRKNSEAHRGKTRVFTEEWTQKIADTMASKPKLICPDCNKNVGWHESHLEAHKGSKNCRPANTDIIKEDSLIRCIHCGKESSDSANMHKLHGIYCKENPNRMIRVVKEHPIYTCPNCEREIKSKGNLTQHLKKCKPLN